MGYGLRWKNRNGMNLRAPWWFSFSCLLHPSKLSLPLFLNEMVRDNTPCFLMYEYIPRTVCISKESTIILGLLSNFDGLTLLSRLLSYALHPRCSPMDIMIILDHTTRPITVFFFSFPLIDNLSKTQH